MKHSQDKGTDVSKALASLPDDERAALLRRGLLTGRIGGQRNYEDERRVNELYEELRLLTNAQLHDRAGVARSERWSRQMLISEVYRKELPDGR